MVIYMLPDPAGRCRIGRIQMEPGGTVVVPFVCFQFLLDGTCQMDTKKDVADERKALDASTTKLGDFINTDEYNALEQQDRDLLVDQHFAMVHYRDALDARLARFEQAEAAEKETKKADDEK